ncbi:hypothetical protein GCM10011385_41480 [Nitratireductor aestuarii]|uniref:DUF4145 domain-containing protein n=1 Tax=Nitratireductor aestuarii TaxID=1735103 RepID=A0A916S425_9HYPH|nr:DUF4145 domain-containing protein [Nitratireductor aestuarii]GGA82991.1 hypothetical protein GCM10011385_41480 [Nitratireductor aestuarii]
MTIEFGNSLKGVDRCPQCNIARPYMSLTWSGPIKVNGNRGVRWGVYECSSCNRLTMVEGFEGQIDALGLVRGDFGNLVRAVYPGQREVDDSLPEEAQRYLKQALETLFAPDAAIVMAASAVDAMLKDKGYSKGSLYTRIDQAVSDHILTEGMGKWAHKVRLDANAVRHADEEAKPPTREDAQQVVDFATALGDFLFVFTARVDEGLKEAGGE